jgi:hypothetical protein
LKFGANSVDDLRIALDYLISGIAVPPKSILIGAAEALLNSSYLLAEADNGILKAGLPRCNTLSNLLHPFPKRFQLANRAGLHFLESCVHAMGNFLVIKNILASVCLALNSTSKIL